MNSLEGKQGYSAIITGLLEWWVTTDGIRKTYVETARSITFCSFESFLVHKIGRVICNHRDYVGEFKTAVHLDPTAQFLYNSLRGKNSPDRMIESQICFDIGTTITKSDWWKRNKPDIHLDRKKAKKIRSILDE